MNNRSSPVPRTMKVHEDGVHSQQVNAVRSNGNSGCLDSTTSSAYRGR